MLGINHCEEERCKLLWETCLRADCLSLTHHQLCNTKNVLSWKSVNQRTRDKRLFTNLPFIISFQGDINRNNGDLGDYKRLYYLHSVSVQTHVLSIQFRSADDDSWKETEICKLAIVAGIAYSYRKDVKHEVHFALHVLFREKKLKLYWIKLCSF